MSVDTYPCSTAAISHTNRHAHAHPAYARSNADDYTHPSAQFAQWPATQVDSHVYDQGWLGATRQCFAGYA
jgi:hypothetical protein